MGSDRPFRRKLWKLGARLFYGGRRAHAQDWLPSLLIERDPSDGSGNVVFRVSTVAHLSSINALAAAAGREIFIVGSGPSIAQADLRDIGENTAILLNGAIALIGSRLGKPLAIAVEDERFVYRHFDRFLEGLDRAIPCLLSVAAIRAICERDPPWLDARNIILIDNIAKPYGHDSRPMVDLARLGWVRLNADQTAGLSLRPEKGVFQGGSVAVSTLQFAFACKPDRIGFLGIDISNAAQPRFYERAETPAFSGVAEAEARILAHFSLVEALSSAQGIELVNFSPVSALVKCGIRYSDRFVTQSV